MSTVWMIATVLLGLVVVLAVVIVLIFQVHKDPPHPP